MAKRRTAFGKILDHFHTHPRGRLHEFLFWAGLGAALALLTLWGRSSGTLSEPIGWMLYIVAACFLLWSLLPQRKPKTQAEPPAGRLRAQKAEAVRASKEEGKQARAAKRGGR